MNTGFLPRNPSKANQSGWEHPFTARKISAKPRNLLIGKKFPPASAAHNPPPHNPSASIQYQQELEQRQFAAQQAQTSWYTSITHEASRQHALSQENLQLAREELYRRAECERRAIEAVKQGQVETRRARLRELEERRRLEEERIQRERAESEAAALAQRLAEEEERRRQVEEAERIRRERLRECIVCFDEDDMDTMLQLACMHWYCRIHIQDAFEIAWTSRTPFQCCLTVVLPETASTILTPEFRAQYELWLEERADPNPVYCFGPTCGIFLPRRLANGPDEIRCNQCARVTCRHCRNVFHPGLECMADISTQQARNLAEREGWKTCPSCANMVERESGCARMTCRCGTQFCYQCGRLYSICSGNC